MKIDENYTLENDSNQWVLNYRSEGEINPKTNKPITTENKWYCGTLSQALNRYLDESLKPSKDIQQLKAVLDLSMKNISLIK